MEGIKQTVRDWYGDFPSQWDTIKFRLGFSFSKGLNITKEDLVDEGIPVISYGQVHAKDNPGTGIIDSLLRYVPDTYLAKNKSCLVHDGDFIFADTSEDYAGVGNVAFVDRETTLFAGYHSIVARPILATMYPKYYAYLFLTDCWRDQVRANVMGVKVFSVTNKLLRDTFILVPPIEEQKRIVAYLDDECSKMDEIIVTIRQQIDILKEYKKSLVTNAVTKGIDDSADVQDSGTWIGSIPVGWEMSKIKYLVDGSQAYPIGDGDHGMIKADDYLTEGIPYIRVLNLTWGNGLSMEDIVYIDESMNSKIKNSELHPNDILIAKTGATIGKTAIVPDWMPRSNTTSHVGKITLPKTHCPKFFYHQMNSDVIQLQIADLSAMQSTRPELGIEGLKNLVVVVPPIEVQESIANYLDSCCEAIDAVIESKQTQLDVMTDRKASLIFEYVTGKRRVKEVV